MLIKYKTKGLSWRAKKKICSFREDKRFERCKIQTRSFRRFLLKGKEYRSPKRRQKKDEKKDKGGTNEWQRIQEHRRENDDQRKKAWKISKEPGTSGFRSSLLPSFLRLRAGPLVSPESHMYVRSLCRRYGVWLTAWWAR